MCRGENETVITKRVIPVEIVREAIVIVMALVTFALLIAGILFVTESGRQISSDALFFEAVSAITTTGLSVGDTTASLSTAGKIVVMCAMFIGRLGALTVVMMIGDRESNRVIRFPSEEIVVG
jgi:trk system potassium uptake protein TrkH